MYERSAIVLERFFSNLLGLRKVNNLKKNFSNYCELFEKFKVVQQANSEEFAALKEFQSAENEIEEVQNHEEKLYKKNAKLEYNRDLIFQDISQKPDEIEKCSEKIEADIAKTQEKLVTLRFEFVEAVRDYNDKKSTLSKCKKVRKTAENEYNAIFEETQNTVQNIPAEVIATAKEFADSEILPEIIATLAENGKDEKIPFNNQVITNAAKIGFDITVEEVECYLEAYNLAQKLVNELLEGAVSMELHEKTIRNISAKLNFLAAEKEYMVGFLDYERITVIYGKRMHRSLMVDACEKLEKDMEQVQNLYQILLKEVAEKSTKKAYRDLYNKSYLMEIEDKDAKFKKEKNRVNIQTGTVMNSNYWRIEGIKNIYTVFYKTAVEVFGKDLDEFEIPEEQDESDEDVQIEQIDEIEDIEEPIIEEVVAEQIPEEAKPKKAKVVEAEIVEEKPKATKATKTEKVQKAEVVEPQEVEPEIIEPEEIEPIKVEAAVSEEDAEFDALSSRIDSVFDEIDDLDELEEEIVKPKKAESKKVESKKSSKVYTSKTSLVKDKLHQAVMEEPEEIEEVSSKKTLKLAKIVKKRGRKKVRHFTRQIVQVEENIVQDIPEVVPNKESKKAKAVVEEPEEFDIFGEKYRDIDAKLAELEDLEEYQVAKAAAKFDDESYEEKDEESIFEILEDEDKNVDLAEIELPKTSNKKEKSKNKLFDSFKKLNSKSKKNLANE